MRLLILSAVLFLPTPAASDYIEASLGSLASIAPGYPDVQKVATGFTFTEGPVWVSASGWLIFSDIDGNQQWKHTPPSTTVSYRTPSQRANGNTLDLSGNVLSCEQTTGCVSKNGTPFISTYGGARFNAPNDIVVKSDGTIWFTDPDYGAPSPKPQALNRVYRADADGGNVTPVQTTFNEPNGLCFSPDESKLYVADSGTPHHIRAFTVNADNSLTEIGTSFVTISPGVPDGIRCDPMGRLYSSCGNGVQIFEPDKTYLGTIVVPEKNGAMVQQATTNLCFGGSVGKTLFMTSKTSLYSVQVEPLAPLSGGSAPPGGEGCGALGLEVLAVLLIGRRRARAASRPASR